MEANNYYYSQNGAQQGPVSKEGLKQAGITPQTQVWCNGMTDWTTAANVPALADLFAQSAPPPVQQQQQTQQYDQQVAPQYGQQTAPQQGQQYGQQQGNPYGNPTNYNQTNVNVGQALKPNGMATASLVCALIGLLLIPWLLGLLAIIFGIVGLTKSSTEYRGRGAAVAGLIIGVIDIAWGFVWVAIIANSHMF